MSNKANEWTTIGAVAVDGGTLLVGDPCRILDDNQADDAGAAYLAAPVVGDCKGNGSRTAEHSGGIVLTAGYGDGIYPVEVRRLADGTIAEVRIRFVDDASEEAAA